MKLSWTAPPPSDHPCLLHSVSCPQASLLSQALSITYEQACWFYSAQPRLLVLDTCQVANKVLALSRNLGCSLSRASAVAVKAPHLLITSSRDLAASLDNLSRVLQLSRATVGKAVLRIPGILQIQPADVRAQLEAVAGVWQLPYADVLRLAAKEPLLFVTTKERFLERVGQLAQTLQRPSTEVLDLVSRYPKIAAMAPLTVGVKVEAIASGLKLTKEKAVELVLRQPPLLLLPPSRTQDHVARLSKLLPSNDVHHMVLEEPSLLQRSVNSSRSSYQTVQRLLGVEAEDVAVLLTRRPTLLTKSPTSLEDTYRALSVWELSDQDKLTLITAHPLLLRLSRRELQCRCRWLRSLMMGQGLYHARLRRLDLNLLGVLIMHLPKGWSRLQYLAETNQESKMDFLTSTQCSDSDFVAAFPEYVRWHKGKRNELVGLGVWGFRVVERQGPNFGGGGGRAHTKCLACPGRPRAAGRRGRLRCTG